MCFFLILFLFKIIHLKGRVTQIHTTHTHIYNIHIFYLLVHSSYDHNSQDWARRKSQARNFSLVTHIGAGAHTLGQSFAAFLNTLAWNHIGSGLPWFEIGTHTGCQCCRKQLNKLQHNVSLSSCFLYSANYFVTCLL